MMLFLFFVEVFNEDFVHNNIGKYIVKFRDLVEF